MAAITEAPHNSYMSYLMVKKGETYEKLIDIKDYSDLGSAPPTLDTTTLSDDMHTYILDIKDSGGAITFTCNYTSEGYAQLLEYENKEQEFAVWFGGKSVAGVMTPDGNFGKFSFAGFLSVAKTGAGVGAVQDMTVSIAPTKPIKFDSGTSASA